MFVKLNQKEYVIGEQKYMNKSKEWIDEFLTTHMFSNTKIDKSSVKELERNFDSFTTHAGLIYYYHHFLSERVRCLFATRYVMVYYYK